MVRVCLLIILLGAATFGAHCPQDPPPGVTITHPSPGMAVQKTCYVQFGFCVSDTFYQAKLHDQMVMQFRNSQHAVVGRLDSLRLRFILDTSWYNGKLVAIDTLDEENLWMSILSEWKGTAPKQLYFKDTLPHFPPDVSPTTYVGLVDTPMAGFFSTTVQQQGGFILRSGARAVPFISFFNDADHVRHLGLGPTDGCYFEATAYVLIAGRIHRQGIEGERMPGVSLSLDQFLGEVQFLGGSMNSSVPSITKIDSSARDLPFHYGKTRIRRVFPANGSTP
jgi:hypothetical protein